MEQVRMGSGLATQERGRLLAVNDSVMPDCGLAVADVPVPAVVHPVATSYVGGTADRTGAAAAATDIEKS
jgi:hypothetical protein